MMDTGNRVFVEIVAKKKGCMLCDLAVAILEELSEDMNDGILQWDIVDVSDATGLKRYDFIAKECKGKPPIPSIVINGHIAFDTIPDMIERAENNRKETTFANVTFLEASAEGLPFPDDSFDVVLSNGVFNLIPDKTAALSETYRVLKAGGRFQIADQVLTGKPIQDDRSRVDTWANEGAEPHRERSSWL